MSESVGLVLAGGGARGAYELGALSVLLPWLAGQGHRPDVIVGTSIGALNAVHLAAHARVDASSAVEAGSEVWKKIGYGDVLKPLLSFGQLATFMRLGMSWVLPTLAPRSLLNPAPLLRTIPRLIDFDQVHANVGPGAPLRACAVVATAAHSNRAIVFHDGGGDPSGDERRGIGYVSAPLSDSHVRASAAIPVAFRAVPINEPASARGWYFDGGTRLNTPIKPALALGAKRVIVIGLNAVARMSAADPGEQADLFDGASQIAQGLLTDPVVNDLETLAATNATLLAGGPTAGPATGQTLIPYIFVAPQTPNRIGEIAADVYKHHYRGLRWMRRSWSVAMIGRCFGASRNSTRGELFSFLFFDPEFARALIELGREDAERWKRGPHDDGTWQLRPMPGR